MVRLLLIHYGLPIAINLLTGLYFLNVKPEKTAEAGPNEADARSSRQSEPSAESTQARKETSRLRGSIGRDPRRKAVLLLSLLVLGADLYYDYTQESQLVIVPDFKHEWAHKAIIMCREIGLAPRIKRGQYGARTYEVQAQSLIPGSSVFRDSRIELTVCPGEPSGGDPLYGLNPAPGQKGVKSMNSAAFDLESLVRAIAIGLGISLIGGAIGFFPMRRREDWNRWRPVLIMGIAGVMLLVTVGLYYAWPSLVEVPSLGGISQAEAENLLTSKGLVPAGRPQYGSGTNAGRVVPHSQSPGSGLRVRPGTMVSFAVSVREDPTPPSDGTHLNTGVALFHPKSGEGASFSRGADGVYKCFVSGTSTGLSAGGLALLLWLKPVNPPSDTQGWYLQRPPANGIFNVKADGSWSGVAQLGNAQWPPHEGDVFDLAVSAADDGTAKRLFAEPGVVVRNEPIGIKSDTATGVVVELKP